MRALLIGSILLSGVAASADGGELFFKPGFTLTLKGEDAERGFRDAIQFGRTVIAQVGNHYITAVNDGSSSERWRYESKTGSIRKMHHRGDSILVEAQDLMLLDAATGRVKWTIPLNCYSADSCNSRIRRINDDVAVLSGFDGKDDRILLVDVKSGQRLWPNWVQTGKAEHIVFTPGTIVVAMGVEPYAVVGLNRYTGRERWRFRPQGTASAAAGLLCDHKTVTAWWSSKSADEVYSLGLESGKPLYDWMVARRASSIDESRGGGPGFFYAYQPSVLGGGGTARAWNNRDGEPLWRKRISVDFAPELLGAHLFVWATTAKTAAFVAYDARHGKEAWRYERRGIDGHDETYQGEHLLIRIIGDQPFVAVLQKRTGKILGVGPLHDEELHTAILRESSKNLFALSAGKLVRLEPTTGVQLLAKFEEYVEAALLDEAKALHKELRPFVNELPAAATIHSRVVSQDYRRQAASMKVGSLPALLPVLLRMSGDNQLLYYSDFKSFVSNAASMTEKIDPRTAVSGKDKQRLEQLTKRTAKLISRFERRLGDADKGTLDALVKVVVRLSSLLLESGEVTVAHKTLWDVYNGGWMDKTDEAVATMKRAVGARVRAHMSALEKGVARDSGADTVLFEILEIEGLSLLIQSAPGVDAIPNMQRKDYIEVFHALRQALNTL